MLIVSLIFALSIGFNALTMQQTAVMGTSANRSVSPQIRKLRTQGFGLRICGPISYRKHLRICGKKIEIYRKSAKSTTSLRLFLQFLINTYLPEVE